MCCSAVFSALTLAFLNEMNTKPTLQSVRENSGKRRFGSDAAQQHGLCRAGVAGTLDNRFQKERAETAALAVLLALALGLGGNAGLKRATHAEDGDLSEMLSWPIQQLARARLYDGGKLDDEEKAAIDELMPGEAWRLYDPTVSDPVKFEF